MNDCTKDVDLASLTPYENAVLFGGFTGSELSFYRISDGSDFDCGCDVKTW